jgi:hypothetical protein
MKKKTFRSIWKFPLHRLRVNRKYKDRLFLRIFQDKKDLLDLYNAVNGTDYSNPEDLEITTLEDAIYMSMKNDISFIVSSTMNLYEHQSTLNPNMPVRGFLYFARLYEAYIERNGLNVFGQTAIQLPFPQYIVFYNGEEDCPDDYRMLLSDSFAQTSSTEVPAVECCARIININFGHNKSLMNKSHLLLDYSRFVSKIREKLKNGIPLQHAVDETVNECLQEGILFDLLTKSKAEVTNMLLTEFDQKKYEKAIRKESYDFGYDSGYDSGYQTGKAEQATIIAEQAALIEDLRRQLENRQSHK